MILNFLSFLFPSWKLFDETFEIPVLLYQVDGGEWKHFLENRPPKTYELFFNPIGILYLLIQSKTHRLLNDLASEPIQNKIEDNANFQFFKKLITDRLSEYQFKSFRFKLMYLSNNEEILISNEYYAS